MGQALVTRRQLLQRSLMTAGAMYLGSTQALVQPARGATPGGTLRIARPLDSVSLDPYRDTNAPSTWVFGQINETLLTLTPEMKILPGLARGWRVTSPSRVRLFLRRGIKFHDGTPFNAAAVKFNFDRVFNPSAPGFWASFAGPIKDAEVVDDSTVDIVATEPYSPLLISLASAAGAMVSPTAVQRYSADYGRNPVGTGPFKFVEWKPNEQITLTRNLDYWGKQPYLDRIVYRVIPEDTGRIIALRTREVDMVLYPPAEELPRLQNDHNIRLYKTTGNRTIMIFMNLSQAPMSDERVRHALMMGFNRQDVITNLVHDLGTIANGIMPPTVFGFAAVNLEKRYPYDPKAARALLEQAGYRLGNDGIMQRAGSPLVLTMISSKGRYPRDAELAEAFQAQMRELGVRIDLKAVEFAALVSAMRAANLSQHLILGSYASVNGDADQFLTTLFRSDQVPPKGWNDFRYGRPDVDKLLDAGRIQVSLNERQKAYAQVQEDVAQDLPLIPLYNMNNLYVVRSTVNGFAPHHIEFFLPLAPVWLQQ
jgi:ABC-type transport system substrate-binding protein